MKWYWASAIATTITLLSASGAAAGQLSDDEIAALRAQGEIAGWTFTVGENDATRLALDNLCGLVEPPDWRQRGRFDSCFPTRELPPSFNWCSLNACTPIRDQGGACGSCWAFSAIGVLESAIRIKDGGAGVDLSEQWLVSCTSAGNCAAGWAYDALEYLQCSGLQDPCGHSGAVLESDFPYAGWNAPCSCPYSHPYCLTTLAYVGTPSGIPSVAQIKQAILDRGLVSAAVYADNAFQAYGGGVYNACQNLPVNHAVVIVGWDDSQGNGGVWIVRNSWGTGWGENGYMRIEYGCSNIGYATCYIDYEGMRTLDNGRVSPNSGTDLTDFTFEVAFRDSSGQPPTLAVAQTRIAPGSWMSRPMQFASGSITTGVVYRCVTRLPAGSYYHRFFFRTADGTELIWPDADGNPGPNVGLPDGLQVTAWSIPSGPGAYQPGQSPVLRCEVRDPDGNLLDADSVGVYISPPGGLSPYVSMMRTSLGHYEYNGDNWHFGCDCYTFTFVAQHWSYASGSCTLEFRPCPCPSFTPVHIDPMSVSPPQIVAGAESANIVHGINVEARESVWVRDSTGSTVRTLLNGEIRTAGSWTDVWDGTNGSGQTVPSGAYTGDIEALHLDSDHPMWEFGVRGSGYCKVNGPYGLAVGPDGDVYVLDFLASGPPWFKIVRFNADGTCAGEFTPPYGGYADQVSGAARAIAVDNAGNVHILDDQPYRRITVWSGATGQWLRQYATGLMSEPDQGSLTPIYYDSATDRVYVWGVDVAGGGSKVFVFDGTTGGLVLPPIDPEPASSAHTGATGLAVDGEGNIWIITYFGPTYVLTHSGQEVRRLTGSSWAEKRILVRWGRLVYLRDAGGIYVYDIRGNLLQSICTISYWGGLQQIHLAGPAGEYFYAAGGFRCGAPMGPGIGSRIRDFNSADQRGAPISVVAGRLTTWAPNGGEDWPIGSRQEINWYWSGTVGNVTIRLWKGGSEYLPASPIAVNIPNTGSYDWSLPDTLEPGTDYRVRIEEAADPTIQDTSDADFTVTMPVQLMNSVPADEASLCRSANNVIRLTFDGDITAPTAGQIRIEKMLDGGLFDTNLAPNFTFTVQYDGNGQPRILKIQETTPCLAHRTWVAVRNMGGPDGWSGVTPFKVQYLVQVGDVNNDGKVLASDLSSIFPKIPTPNAGDQERADVNGDGKVLASDLSAVFPHIPSSPVPKPTGH